MLPESIAPSPSPALQSSQSPPSLQRAHWTTDCIPSFGYFLLGFSVLHAGAEAAFRYREGGLQILVMLLYLIWLGVLFLLLSRLHWSSWRSRLISTALLLWVVAAPLAGAR